MMDDTKPVAFTWTEDGVMKPLDRFMPLADKQFVVGETYRMVVEAERSAVSHSHYFACLHEAWTQLPENIAPLFPTSEKLRRWALIKTGFANEQSMVCDTEMDTARMAQFLGQLNDDSVVVRKGRVLKIYTAKSQSARSMNKDEFQRSKQSVLDLLASMIGTSAAELASNAGKAA